MRFSYQLLPEQPLEELLALIELMDRLGFWACYSADETYHKDMWSLFAAAAARTSRIRMGPEVSGVILKDPTIIAQHAATLDELTGGRAELVFSTGNFAMLQQYHVDLQGTRRPIARLREAHEVLSMFLAEGKIDFQGDHYAYSGLFTAARPVQAPFPIKLGGMRGPRSFELAGEIADGLHTALAYSREALDFTAAAFQRGAERAGRDWTRLDLADNVLGAIAEDAEPAREAARVIAAFYISSMPPELLERHGINPAEVAPIVEAFKRGDVRRALEGTPPRLGEALSVAGTPSDWIEWIEEDFVPAGFAHLLVTFADPFLVESWAGISIDGLPTLDEQIQLFRREVMAGLSSSLN
jgi:alkanesulfonate monooxygenase SsuD/methylene tetrahydromethanopterin reductase-like flavin-dependent oxidoreductase (luciferase family)